MNRTFKLPLIVIIICFSLFIFSCRKKAEIPVITTDNVSNVSQTSAVSGGEIVSAGSSDVTTRGVCWGTDANPTISNSITNDGSGIGSFTSVITGLNPGTVYHTRAYATNNAGTSYGSDLQFTTASPSATDGGNTNNNGNNGANSTKPAFIIEGKSFENSSSNWNGVVIPHSSPANLIFRNNSITSVNSEGYMLQAGDETPQKTNNKLDGETISGNKFTWNGTDKASTITHGIFTGYNINCLIEYNYLSRVPTGMVLKSNGMTYDTGGVAYNIINQTGDIGIAVKGINGVQIYNNTFYSNEVTFTNNSAPGTAYGIVDIFANNSPKAYSKGTKIKNNIFYTVNQVYNISIEDSQDLEGFESDYNLFWCEAGTPVFNYLGTKKTFAEWQALGYDTHSVVVNPNFNNFNDFVPAARLDYGTDLGAAWLAGLSTTAVWTVGSVPASVSQNGVWQVGARLY